MKMMMKMKMTMTKMKNNIHLPPKVINYYTSSARLKLQGGA